MSFRILSLLFVLVLVIGCGGGGDDDEGDWVEETSGQEDVSGQPDTAPGDVGGTGDTASLPGEVPQNLVTPDDFCADLPAAKEGDIGFWHRSGVECYQGDEDPVDGDEVHVSPDGSDDDGDGTAGAPFKTIGRALCGVIPGQTVMVHPGTYNESILLGSFGETGNPIVIQGVEGGEMPVMDGGGCLTVGILLIESTAFEIRNIKFQRYTDEGAYIASSQEVTVEGCTFMNNGFDSVDPDFNHEGFGFTVGSCKDVNVKGNTCDLNGPGPDIFAQAVLGMGIDTFELEDAEISGNTIQNTIGGGILVEEGVNVDVTGNTITGNYLYAAGDYWDGGVWVDGGHHVTVTDNVITDNMGPGIQVSDADAKFPYFSCHYTVTGNTIKDNYWSLYIMNFGICPMPPEVVLTWADNELSGNAYPGEGWEKDATTDGVLCESWPCGEGLGCTDDDFDKSVKHCE